jgi:L-alanine-DL-glutamate epimerase-like enolase superfamily enzyme
MEGRFPPADAGAPASARFALESAWLDLAAQRQGLPLWRLLRETAPAPEELPVATVFEPGASPVSETVKVKLSANWAKELVDVEALVASRAELGETLRLRMDFNQRLAGSSREGRTAALEAVAAFHPEFVEEPACFEDAVAMDAPVPLALDESLQDPRAEAWLAGLAQRRHPFGVLVLKPTALGGVERSLRVAKIGADMGLVPVVSHCLEGAVARAVLVHVAFACMDGSLAAGLGANPGDEPGPGILRRPEGPGVGGA